MKITEVRMNPSGIGKPKTDETIGADPSRVNGARKVTEVIRAKRVRKYGPQKEIRIPKEGTYNRDKPQYDEPQRDR